MSEQSKYPPYYGKVVVKISETANEYLLFIHASQKERARRIPEWRWDTVQKCWVYPRTERIYEVLKAEFNQDLSPDSNFSPPSHISKAPDTTEKSDEKLIISKQVSTMQKTLKKLIKKEYQTKVEKLEAQLREKDNLLHKSEEDKVKLKFELTKLAKEGKSGKIDLGLLETSEALRLIAINTTGKDPAFTEMINEIRIDKNLPIEICKYLAKILEIALNAKPRTSLSDLIGEAKVKEVFDEDQASLAHLIRQQRNIKVHEDFGMDERALMARAILCLFAAAVLWPDLPE